MKRIAAKKVKAAADLRQNRGAHGKPVRMGKTAIEGQFFKLRQKLHEYPRNWIENQHWEDFRQIQKQVIPHFLHHFDDTDPAHDYVIAAPTASGKTEAIFLPLASIMHAAKVQRKGAQILYVCPLTTLIDQQRKRLHEMFDEKRFPVIAWHARASVAGKKSFWERPDGAVIIITPESLEAQFVNHGADMQKVYGNVRCCVVDEFHSFFDNARGCQLLSLFARLEDKLKRKIPRIALSATFHEGINRDVQELLRPEAPERVEVLRDTTGSHPIEFTVKCFADKKESSSTVTAMAQIIEELKVDFDNLTPANKGLIFTNSRHWTDTISHGLHVRNGQEANPRVYFPHHGSLSPAEKSAAEKAIRVEDKSATLVCTTTLELGIDIGSIHQVGQIDPPSTVSSLQQRLGRSGRKHNAVSRLIAYVRDARSRRKVPTDDGAALIERLHFPTLQMLAQVELVMRKEFEAPDRRRGHLSTLVQQIVSLAAERTTVTKEDARRILLQSGPFSRVCSEEEIFELLFARLELAELLSRDDFEDADYRLGRQGENLKSSHTFYAAFQTGTDYAIYGPGGHLGQMPLAQTYRPGDRIIFSGNTWTIISISRPTRTVRVEKAAQGQAPHYPGDPIPPSQKVIDEMRALLRARPTKEAKMNLLCEELYKEAVNAYRDYGLDKRSIVPCGASCHLLFPWQDARGQNSLISALRHRGISAIPLKIAIYVENTSAEELKDQLRVLSRSRVGLEAMRSSDEQRPATVTHPVIPPSHEAARGAASLVIDKHDHLLSPFLQRWNYASFRLEMEKVPKIAVALLKDEF